METKREKIEIWFDSYEEIRDKAKLYDELMANQTNEKNLVILPDWQMKQIEDTLRVTSNIHHSQDKITCHDRMLCKAWGFAKKSLEYIHEKFKKS